MPNPFKATLNLEKAHQIASAFPNGEWRSIDARIFVADRGNQIHSNWRAAAGVDKRGGVYVCFLCHGFQSQQPFCSMHRTVTKVRRFLMSLFSRQWLVVCGSAGGNDEIGQFRFESFRLFNLIFKFFHAQLAFKQAVFVFALDADDLNGGGATRVTPSGNFHVESNTVLCLTGATVSLSPESPPAVFQNVLAKLLEQFVIVRCQEAVKVAAHVGTKSIEE